MRVNVTKLTFWKTEHTESENEDACGYSETYELYAVSDGVGETSFSHQWAPVLVERFLKEPLFSDEPFEVEHWVRGTQRDSVGRVTDANSLPDPARTKARLGASGTLLGLGLVQRAAHHAGPVYSYKVTAIGDCNFFHWRTELHDGGRKFTLQKCFPITESRAFGTLPDSINHINFNRDNIRAHVLDATTDPSCDLHDGDVLMLATDAIAKWILSSHEHGASPMVQLMNMPEDRWQQIIRDLRANRLIVNDDSTLLIIRVESTSEGDPLPALPENTDQRSNEMKQVLQAYLEGRATDIEVALAYGDGNQLEDEIRMSASAFAEQSRERANAFKNVSDAVAFYLAARPEDRQQRLPRLVAAWVRNRHLLINLSWTSNLRHTLETLGVDALDGPTPEIVQASEPLAERIGTGVGGVVEPADDALRSPQLESEPEFEPQSQHEHEPQQQPQSNSPSQALTRAYTSGDTSAQSDVSLLPGPSGDLNQAQLHQTLRSEGLPQDLTTSHLHEEPSAGSAYNIMSPVGMSADANTAVPPQARSARADIHAPPLPSVLDTNLQGASTMPADMSEVPDERSFDIQQSTSYPPGSESEIEVWEYTIIDRFLGVIGLSRKPGR